MNTAFQWSPLLPFLAVALLAAGAIAIFTIAKWKQTPAFYWRGLLCVLFGFLLLNPVMMHETRQSIPGKLVIVVDESPSQAIAGRDETAEKILSYIQASLSSMPHIQPVVLRAGLDAASLKNQNTSVFTALRDSLMSFPLGQVAGTVLITDGQVHDVPENLGSLEKLAPFHAVLTGKKDEFDRKITVVEAPKYGLLGDDIRIKVKVDEIGKTSGMPAALTVRQDAKPVGQYTVTTGEVQEYTFKLEHSGQNIFEFFVAAEKDELTAMNNTAAIIVNGVRDRLKVLLVSGTPHIGERAWRDLLKSDPAIDLVHFTILRSPTSFDATPVREMSLIAFPVEELFEKKIREFDLIIFDKYAQYGLMQDQYFANIAAFVKDGGAFLMAMGSDKPEQSLFQTALGEILPVAPQLEEQSILSQPYLPQLTEVGKTHPVTGDLQAPWGQWFSQVDIRQTRGQTLMLGADDKPLLILDKAGKGRVAVLTSDNIWLWSKGMKGGGPYTELLRHVAHWLMKEPELEEDYLKAEAKGNVITVSMRDLTEEEKSVTLTRPNGETGKIILQTKEKGWMRTKVTAGQNGIYRFSNGTKTALAIVGTAHSEEFSDVHTTEEKLNPVVGRTKGAMIWYSESPRFSFRDVGAGNGNFGGKDWIGLKDTGAYSVQSVKSGPLVPNWLALLVIFGGLLHVWWRESR